MLLLLIGSQLIHTIDESVFIVLRLKIVYDYNFLKRILHYESKAKTVNWSLGRFSFWAQFFRTGVGEGIFGAFMFKRFGLSIWCEIQGFRGLTDWFFLGSTKLYLPWDHRGGAAIVLAMAYQAFTRWAWNLCSHVLFLRCLILVLRSILTIGRC